MSDEPAYKRLERVGEQLYDELDRPGSHHGVLSEIKECFEGAIADARERGLGLDVRRLEARLDRIKAVHRQQFGTPDEKPRPSRPGRLRKEKVGKNTFEEFVRPLFGDKVSHIWRGAGSAIFLEFGALTPRSLFDGSPGQPEGEMSLMIEWSWRIEGRRRIIAGSWSKEEKWPRAFRLLQKGVVGAAYLSGNLPEIRLRFTNGVQILSFNTSTGDPQWTLFRRFPDGNCWITVRGGALSLEWVDS